MMGRVRAAIERIRFDEPARATRVSVAWAVALVPVLTGLSRATEVESAAEIVPMSRYETLLAADAGLFETLVQIGLIVPLLAVSDAIGRLWLAVLGWVPAPAANAFLTAAAAGLWLLTMDFAARTAAANRDLFVTDADADAEPEVSDP